MAGAASLYAYTLAPTLLWGDDAMFQRALAMGDLTSHPVWGILARLFARLPWRGPAFRANAASAVYAVGAIGFLFLLTLSISGSVRAALAAGALLAISHAFWLHAVRAEVYTLHLLFCFGGLWAVLRWREATGQWPWLLLGLAFWLVGLVNHLLLALAIPGGLVLVLGALDAVERRRVLYLLLALVVAATILTAFALPTFFTEILPGSARTVHAWFGFSVPRIAVHLVLWAYQFPLCGLMAAPGLGVLWRQERTLFLGIALMALCTAAFASTFGVLDSYVFNLPAYGLGALLIGLGAAGVTAHWRWPRWLLIGATVVAAQIGLYRITPTLANRVAPGIVLARDLPGRDADEFFLWPAKRGYVGARWFAESTLSLVAPEGIVMADWTPFAPLQYLQDVEGQRPDVLLVHADSHGVQVLREFSGQRPLFLANDNPRYYPIDKIEEHFRLEAVGHIYELRPREGNP
jgi:hypothetical protein